MRNIKKILRNYRRDWGISFYGNKIITTGEGGAILTNSPKLKKMYELKTMEEVKKEFSNMIQLDTILCLPKCKLL